MSSSDVRGPSRFAAPALAGLFAASVACGSFEPMIVAPPATSVVWSREQRVEPRDGRTIRFLAVGDAGSRKNGEPHPDAVAVAGAARDVCRDKGCDFALFLGDNLYETGVNDDRDRAAFVELYGLYPKAMPLYFALGNHDWGPHFLAYFAPPETERARRELSLIAAGSPIFRGQSHFYDFEAGPARLFVWDTNYLVHQCEDTDEEGAHCAGGPQADIGFAKVFGEIGASRAGPTKWVITAGHHPYWSNGDHGNAGAYDPSKVIMPKGKGFKHLFDTHVKGKADLYLSGHDHNLQAYLGKGLDGTAVVVSGAGGKTKCQGKHANDHVAFEAYGDLGFALVEASASAMAVTFYRVKKGGAVSQAFVMTKGAGDAAWSAGSGGGSTLCKE